MKSIVGPVFSLVLLTSCGGSKTSSEPTVSDNPDEFSALESASSSPISCNFSVNNEMTNSATAEISIFNHSNNPLTIDEPLVISDPIIIQQIWGGYIDSADPYSIYPSSWNLVIPPSGSILIGIVIEKQNGELVIPELGGVCAEQHEGNRAPVIEGQFCDSNFYYFAEDFLHEFLGSRNELTCTIIASDSDGDPLTYTIDLDNGEDPITNFTGSTGPMAFSGSRNISGNITDGEYQVPFNFTVNSPNGFEPEINFTCDAEEDSLTVNCDGSATTDPDGDNMRFAWEFIPGVSHSFTSTASYTYEEPGEYEIAFFAFDGHNFPIGRTTVIVPKSDKIAAELGFSCQNIIFYGDNFSLGLLGSSRVTTCSIDQYSLVNGDNTISENNLEYTWYWGDGDNTATSSASIQHIYVASGGYDIRVVVTDTESNTTTSKTLFFEAIGNGYPPVPILTCSEASETLTVRCDASASSDLEGDSLLMIYGWGDGDLTVQGSELESHTYSEPGTYTITLYVMDSGPDSTGGYQRSFSVEVIVDAI